MARAGDAFRPDTPGPRSEGIPLKLRVFYRDFELEDPTAFGISSVGKIDVEDVTEEDVVFLCEQIGSRGIWLRSSLFLPSSAILGIGIFNDDESKLERSLPGMGPVDRDPF